MTTPKHPRAPDGLSVWAQGIWRELNEEKEFTKPELVLLTRALRAWDLADTFLPLVESERGAGKFTGAFGAWRDASQTALRYWKALGFKDEATPVRRPGRPSGDDWSAHRKSASAGVMASLRRGGA